jgi:hypothetical protein
MLRIGKFFSSLIPFDSLTITTSLTFSEVLQRLDEVLTPPKLFRITLPFGPPPAIPLKSAASSPGAIHFCQLSKEKYILSRLVVPSKSG